MRDYLIDIVRAAGREVLDVYGSAFAVGAKSDNTPLTEADLRAHRVIEAGLAELTPNVPMISEESSPPPFSERCRWRRYWLVDPLDGTKEFVNRNGEFTVNVALIEEGAPVLGVVGVPVQERIYVGDRAQGRAWRLDADGETVLRCRPMRGGSVTVVASRHHGGLRIDNLIEQLQRDFDSVSRAAVGSSLKFCMLADGEADLYPRLAPTSEWDVAAAHAVLAAAGGAVMDLSGRPLRYNAKASLANPEFLAVADPDFHWPRYVREHGVADEED